MPRVSVIIPVYNGEKYIAECVESVLSQTYRDFEIIVVDDGSTDKTAQVIKQLNHQLTYVFQKNKGSAAAFNTGIRNSCGEYLVWLSADDLLMPEALAELISFLAQNPDVQVVDSDYYLVDAQGAILSECRWPYYPDKREFLYHMLEVNFFGSAVMFERRCIDTVGYFDEETGYAADANMWFRMAKYFRLGHIPKFLLKYRWHTENTSHHFWRMRRYLRVHYKKVLGLYEVAEFFPPGYPRAEAYYEVALILARHSIYSLALAQVAHSLRMQPRNQKYRSLALRCLKRLPGQLGVEIVTRLFSVRQQLWITKYYFRVRK